MSTSAIVKRLGLGRLALQLFHRPVGRIRQSLRHGGPIAQRATESQRRAMETAASSLPPSVLGGKDALTLHIMTGRRFWYQTAFCLYSLYRSGARSIDVHLYDDGTIDDDCAARLRRLGPGVTIHFAAELRERVDEFLPRHRFPVLRERWDNYPNIRKLLDVHAGSSGWKLVIDSDLLFFRRPEAILRWAADPQRILHAIDCSESYGYSRGLLEQVAGARLPNLLNVGICGVRSDALDWEQLEAWTDRLQREERTNYYLEQALIAVLAARQGAEALPAADYVTLPSRAEVEHPRAVMHHYVDTAKRWYFRYGWRHIAPRP